MIKTPSRNVWLFNSLNFSGNPKWLFLYVLAEHPEIEAYWIADNQAKADRVAELGYPVVTYADRELQRRAGVYVVDQVKENIPDELRDAVLLNLWHGVGVKLIERRMKESHLLPRIARKYIRNNKHYRDTMMLLVTSELMEKHFQEQIDPLPHQIIRADYPQNSVPKLLPDVATFDHDIRARKGLGSSSRIVVWAPTYRLENNAGFTSRALPDIGRLLDVLERTDQLLVLKMHPQLLSDPSYQLFLTTYGDHPRVHFWDNTEDVYEVFDQIDTAIIDYSSIHYDLLARGVTKFIRYVFDIDEPGALEPGLDYESMSVGTLARDFDALLRALGAENEVAPSGLQRLDEAFWGYRADGDVESIIRAAKEYELGDVDLPTLYSFDVFDTLIHRRGVLPRSIFLALRDRLLAEGDAWPAYFARRFEEVRTQAEAAAREAKRKDPRRQARQEFEISIDEIYEYIASVYGLEAEQADRIKTWEIELEIENATPDALMIDRALGLRDGGETVVLISDMYLPRVVVQQMLAAAHPRLAELPLYLSSEYGVQKSTTRLYAEVFADIGYDFREWHHAGDNAHADHKMPAKMGINAELTPPIRLDATETGFLVQAYSHDASLIAGLFHSLRTGGASAVEVFAYRHAAALLVPYVLWVVDDAVRRGYETLYFVARDGHFLKIVADAYIDATGIGLATRYIYGSRRAWRLASEAGGLSEHTFAVFGMFGGSRSIAQVAEQARMRTSDLVEMVPGLADWSAKDRLAATDFSAVMKELRDSAAFHVHMEAEAARDNAIVQKYLRQEIDFSESFAFVDYWGRGYTQDCLVTILESMGDVPTTAPFYYARSIYRSEGNSVRHNFTSANYRLTLVELLLANQPHGTTLGYREQASGTVNAVYESREFAEQLHDATERMLDRFTRDIVALPLRDRRGALHEVFRFAFEHFRVNEQHPDYVAYLAPLRDSVAMGDREREFAPALGLRDYLQYLRTKRTGEVTRSMSISMKRSGAHVRFLWRMQRRYGFRRWAKRLWRRAGQSR